MRISVIGCGYLGAVHASAMAELGHQVIGNAVAARRIIDGRNMLDPAAWRAAGWVSHGLGRP